MSDNDNRILLVGQLDADTLAALEPRRRLVLLADELGTPAEIAQPSAEEVLAQRAADARARSERFWHDLVPGRRTAPPEARHFQPRYGLIKTRQKLKRSPRQRDLTAKAERRSLRGWLKQYIAGQITHDRLVELAKRIGSEAQARQTAAELATKLPSIGGVLVAGL